MKVVAIPFALILLVAPARAQDEAIVLLPADLEWRQVSPGISAMPAWGDMDTGPSARFVRFDPGAAHTLHNHTAGFHGLLVAGSFTNVYQGDPNPVPMTPGSYWFTPPGMPHANTCVSAEPCVIYGQFTGPFDSVPVEEGAATVAAQTGTPAVLMPADLEWTEVAPGISFAPVYGDWTAEPHAKFVRFAPGIAAGMHTHSAGYGAIVVAGSFTNVYPGDGDPIPMPAGTFWYVPGGMPHANACVSEEECVLYNYSPAAFDFAPAEE